MQKRALVFLAEGAEEMEVSIVVDVLRRAKIEVVLAGIDGPGPVTCSRQLQIVPDRALTEVRGDFEVVILPGGAEGARRLAESREVGRILAEQIERRRLVAAICAAPAAFKAHRVFEGARLTAYPSYLPELSGYARTVDQKVVTEPELITSQGPGTAFDFALALVERLAGPEVEKSVRKGLLL